MNAPLRQLAKIMFWLGGALAHPLVAAEVSFQTITPSQWPHVFLYSNASTNDTLLILQELGDQLEISHPGIAPLHAPGPGRTSLVYLIVPAGQSLQLHLAPYFANSFPQAFRYSAQPLIDLREREAAQVLVSSQGEAKDNDCRLVMDSFSALSQQWQSLLVFAEFGCNMATGNEVAPEVLSIAKGAIQTPSGLAHYHKPWLLGRNALTHDQYEEGLAYYTEALHALRNGTDTGDIAQRPRALDEASLLSSLALTNIILAYNREARVYQQLVNAATDNLDQAETIARTYQDHRLLAEVHEHRAALHYVLGDDAGVLENLLIARSEAELLQRPRELVSILGSLGDYYSKWGQMRLALQSYLQQVEIIEDENLSGLGGDAYHNLGKLYAILGDSSRARGLIEASISKFAAQQNAYRVNIIKHDLAAVYEDEGDLETARELLREEVDYLASRQTPWEPLRLRAQGALSRVEAGLGNLEAALDLSNELMAHGDQLAKASSIQTIPIYINHADLNFRMGNADYAIDLLATTLADLAVQPSDRINVMAEQLRIMQTQDASVDSIALADEVFKLIESQQMQLESSRMGAYWNGKMQSIFMSHIDYLLNSRDSKFQERAFVIAERARAVSLRLRRQEVVLAQNSDNPAAQVAWQRLLQQVQSAGEPAADETEEFRRAQQLTEAGERFFAMYGPSTEAVSIEAMTLAEMLENVPSATVLLEFIVGPERSWRFDISETGWKLTDLGSSAELSSLVDASLFEISRTGTNTSLNLRLASERLLKDLQLPQDTQHLLISPAGRLNSLPFSPLLFDDVPLIQNSSVVVVPSFSQFFAGVTLVESEYSLALAVFADPVFDDNTLGKYAVMATDSMRGWSASLPRLPATAAEAEALSSLFPGKDKLILTGNAATQERFFSDQVRNAKIIHIATHGYFNELMPELVGFALTSNDNRDGFVSMSEIAQVQFGADLVVISACSTGQGNEIPGEGNMSLARIFLAQGVDSVVSTLWPVSDRATATFMKEFYTALTQNRNDYAGALRLAQQALRQSPDYRNPYYWAAYTLTTVQASAGQQATMRQEVTQGSSVAR